MGAIGKYEVQSRIGAGGMAEVFRARAPGLGRAERHVAIKRMHPHLSQNPEFVELFFREAQVASTLDHPNLVSVYESGDEGGEFYLVMEYVDGLSLRELIRRVHKEGCAFDLGVALSICASICAGLHHAHERCDADGRPLQIVHRDVSPGNVFVSYDGAVKLGDFGVAKATSEWTAMSSSTGTIRGKVAYMAPEQARGGRVDRRADLFAVGNMLSELIAGKRLLARGGEVEMLHALVFGDHAEFEPGRGDCPPALTEIVRRALQREPEARYATAFELQQALEACALEHGIFAPPSAVASFVAQYGAAATDADPDPDAPTSVRSPGTMQRPDLTGIETTPRNVVPAPDVATRTVDHYADPVDFDRPPARSRAGLWVAAGVVVLVSGAAGIAWSTGAVPFSAANEPSAPTDTQPPSVASPVKPTPKPPPEPSRQPSPGPAVVKEAVGASETPSEPEPEVAVVREETPVAEAREKKRKKKKRKKERHPAPAKSKKPPRGESLFPGAG